MTRRRPDSHQSENGATSAIGTLANIARRCSAFGRNEFFKIRRNRRGSAVNNKAAAPIRRDGSCSRCAARIPLSTILRRATTITVNGQTLTVRTAAPLAALTDQRQ